MEDEQGVAVEQKPEEQKTGWIVEICRFCNQRMYATRQRPRINLQTGQQYLETENVCPPCDNWVITRIPYALARRLSDTIHLPTPEEIKHLPLPLAKERAI